MFWSKKKTDKRDKTNKYEHLWKDVGAVFLLVILLSVITFVSAKTIFKDGYGTINFDSKDFAGKDVLNKDKEKPLLDFDDYDKRVWNLANIGPMSTTTASTTTAMTTTTPAKKKLWPAETVYPEYGAILPFSRIVAYYGNYLSTKMGILGEFEPEMMLEKLKTQVAEWEKADPETPVVPALEYIAVVAQASPGADGKYKSRMPDAEIDKTIELAKEINGIVILDIQIGLSDLQTEVPLLEKYLKMPQVHLAIDPEFAMHNGKKPGTVIGSMDADDVNYVANYLASLVKENDLPPKILIVHRFTQAMVMHTEDIKPLPEVQIVINMDGWGPKWMKYDSYDVVVYKEPVQFAGIKIFYKNDLKTPSTGILTPEEVLKMKPRPIYIQYQ